MKLFLDSADPDAIALWAARRLVDGVTTNPTLLARAGRTRQSTISGICALLPGPVSAEVVSEGCDDMVAEGHALASIATNVVVKLPLTWPGLEACRKLAEDNIAVNMTLCFSVPQAMVAARAGASWVSPFIGRLDDAGIDGMELIEDIRSAYDVHGIGTKVLAASIRSVSHVRSCALAGADAATMPVKVFEAMIHHPLTDAGVAAFLKDAGKQPS